VATKQLDLHGVRHEEAERLVENFVLLNTPPLKIITGNSDMMRSIVESVCSKHMISYERWDWGEFRIF
jgi:hypothetical protein